MCVLFFERDFLNEVAVHSAVRWYMTVKVTYGLSDGDFVFCNDIYVHTSFIPQLFCRGHPRDPTLPLFTENPRRTFFKKNYVKESLFLLFAQSLLFLYLFSGSFVMTKEREDTGV